MSTERAIDGRIGAVGTGTSAGYAVVALGHTIPGLMGHVAGVLFGVMAVACGLFALAHLGAAARRKRPPPTSTPFRNTRRGRDVPDDDWGAEVATPENRSGPAPRATDPHGP